MSIFVARSFLITLLCLSIFTVVAGTAQHGDSTIVFDDSMYRAGKGTDTLPMPVGGMATLAAKLYYPRYLRHTGSIVHGSSKVSVTIDANGSVADISFSPRMHPGLESAVIKAIRSCKWKPALKHNVPVGSKVRIPLNFDTYKRQTRL